AMLFDSVSVARDRAALDRQGAVVAREAGKVAGYRQSIDALARDLKARQDYLDGSFKTHFGKDMPSGDAGLVGTAAPGDPAPAAAPDPGAKISIAPVAPSLQAIDGRQRRFAALLKGAVDARARKAAAAIRSFGLDPATLVRTAGRAQGGPFIPWPGGDDAMPAEFAALATALDHMEAMERGLIAIPSARPTAAPMETSSYGYRRDPFNGHAAFHAGIDFPGRYGQPILAAAKGRVGYVGQRQGYGNVIEVEHGNGLMTRYAHLSGFATRVGQNVGRGDALGRMGSTGRSTGTHLHFEVRLNGQAINPRRFLEVAQDVLQVQQRAKARFADVGNRG
ncbi:MAG: M23 family metallopeptidase, partial [Sphingobium sp.]